jgi:hypothetical protein
MTNDIDLDITNFVNSLENLSQEIENKMIHELRVTGAMIETDYKYGVPTVTARLKTSIHMQHSDFKNYVYSDRKGQNFNGTFRMSDNDKFSVFIGTNVEYAPKIEMQGGKIMGKDALETAFNKNTSGLLERLSKLVK